MQGAGAPTVGQLYAFHITWSITLAQTARHSQARQSEKAVQNDQANPINDSVLLVAAFARTRAVHAPGSGERGYRVLMALSRPRRSPLSCALKQWDA
jgi:hypothetical protein